jgi:hypothetical protein
MTVLEVFLKLGIRNISTFTTVSSEGKPELVAVIIDIQKTYQAGNTVSLGAAEAGITADKLFQWRNPCPDGTYGRS